MGKIPGKWDPMNTAIWSNTNYVTGGSSGNIYLWSGTNGSPTKAGDGAINSLAIDTKGSLYSGCSKGKITIWKISGGRLVA